MTIDKYSLFRIISFSLAGGDVLQTCPATLRLYKKQWVNGNLSPVCIFYALARYMSIISLVSNGIGFFGTNFTPASCKRFYMLPNVTAMLAGMAVQVLVFIRTYAISGRSKYVWFGLGSVMLLCFPVQVFGIVYHRDPALLQGSYVAFFLDFPVFIERFADAKEKFFTRMSRTGIYYYSAHMTFDLLACATATFILVYSSRVGGAFNPSKFVRRVLRNGLLYTVVVFLVNLWVVLEFAGVFSSGAASTLPLAVVMIAAQHLILSTQLLNTDKPSSTEEYRRSHIRTGSGPARFFGGNTTQQDLELQTDIFVVTETTVPPNSIKTSYEPTDRKTNYIAEPASAS